jgi:nitrate reductase gamma subunit
MSAKAWTGLGVAAALVIALVAIQTPLEREQQTVSNTQALVCLDCHRQANVNTNEGVVVSRTFCFSCHGTPESSFRSGGENAVSLHVLEASFSGSPHQYVACIQCHTDVARSPHQTEMGAQCLACHTVHGEGAAHAPHLRVDCQACHYTHEAVVLDATANRIVLASVNAPQDPTETVVGRVNHALQDAGDVQSCRRCHHAQNGVGAPAAVLPAKSVLCLACHPSSATMGHPMFWAAGLIMLVGIFLMLRFWFIGSVQGETGSLNRKISLTSESVWSTLFSRKIVTVIKTLLLDIIFQRRILKESVQRWSMHSLIFIAILLRFALSLFTGFLFSINPESDWALALIDKNHPFTAFAYDFLGLMILLGILWAAVQRFVIKPAHVVTEIKDNITIGLIGLLIILGFLTTGARILLTGIPSETAIYSFIGFPISKMLQVLPLDWRAVYPWLWYAHAAVGAAFIAYLPFGKLKHVFNVPLTYLMEEVDGIDKSKRV